MPKGEAIFPPLFHLRDRRFGLSRHRRQGGERNSSPLGVAVPQPAVPVIANILWQNTNGQAAIWEMNGTTIIGNEPVCANPGPSWLAKA